MKKRTMTVVIEIETENTVADVRREFRRGRVCGSEARYEIKQTSVHVADATKGRKVETEG